MTALQKLILLLLLTTVMLSCKDKMTIGPDIKDKLAVEITDTVTVVASTYLLDSLPTSNTGTILLGTVNDPEFGKVTSSSYMQLKSQATSAITLPESATFEDFKLVLKYNGYHYGDTTAEQHIFINRLKEDIVPRKVNKGIEEEEMPVFIKGEALYSTTTFKYDPVPLGSVKLKPRPNSKDSIAIVLDEALGKELFTMVRNKSNKLYDEKEFLEFFKGIAIHSTDGHNVTGFSADSVKMYLNYNYKNADGFIKKSKIAFVLNLKTHQFNHIVADRSGTKISGLNYLKKELKTEETSNQLFVQGGTGVVAKLRFSGLENLIKEPKVALNKVELVIETKQDSYAIYKAPASLILFIANANSVPKSILTTPFAETTQQAFFQKGDEAGNNGRYVFQLTAFANEIRKGSYKNASLLLSLPLEELNKSVNRLQIVNNKTGLSIKLRITYTKY